MDLCIWPKHMSLGQNMLQDYKLRMKMHNLKKNKTAVLKVDANVSKAQAGKDAKTTNSNERTCLPMAAFQQARASTALSLMPTKQISSTKQSLSNDCPIELVMDSAI